MITSIQVYYEQMITLMCYPLRKRPSRQEQHTLKKLRTSAQSSIKCPDSDVLPIQVTPWENPESGARRSKRYMIVMLYNTD